MELWFAARGIKWKPTDDLVVLRYKMTAGYDGTPATDQGTETQSDCFGWQSAPIAANDEIFQVAWTTVEANDIPRALKRGPILVTIGLTRADADEPELWFHDPIGSMTEYHRVLCGAIEQDSGTLICRSYGVDYRISPRRVVAADLMIHVNAPADFRMAGIDWSKLQV